MSDGTYYVVLGIAETASEAEIKAAYRNLLKRIHPDTVSTLSEELRAMAESATKEIMEAYAVLSDPGRRRKYDRELAESRRRSQPALRVLVPDPLHRPTLRQSSRPTARLPRRRRRSRSHRSQPRSLEHWVLRHPLKASLALLLMLALLFAIISIVQE